MLLAMRASFHGEPRTHPFAPSANSGQALSSSKGRPHTRVLEPLWSLTQYVVLNVSYQLGGTGKKKHLGSLEQQSMVSDQILRLRPQNDTYWTMPLILLIAIRARAPLGVWSGLVVIH
jgi:hypothetical protein